MPRHCRPGRCWRCFTSLAKASCSKCKVARYCSQACQVADWKSSVSGHKTDCAQWAVCGGSDALYDVTLAPAVDERTLGHASALSAIISLTDDGMKAHAAQCGEPYLARNYFLHKIESDEPLLHAMAVSIDATWVVNLIRNDLKMTRSLAKSPMPDGLMALSVFLLRSNNQVGPLCSTPFLWWLAPAHPTPPHPTPPHPTPPHPTAPHRTASTGLAIPRQELAGNRGILRHSIGVRPLSRIGAQEQRRLDAALETLQPHSEPPCVRNDCSAHAEAGPRVCGEKRIQVLDGDYEL